VENSENISEELYSRVESYLMDEMSANERSAFENEMASDNDLAKKVHEIKLLLLGIMEKNLQDKLPSFHEGLYQKKTIFKTQWWAAAAAVIIVSALAWVFLNRKTEPEQLFAKYYTADPGLITTMGGSDEYSFDRAMINYKMGKYTEAATEWEALISLKAANDTLLYFTASAYLAQKETKKAVPYYEKVAIDKNSAFSDDARWYLGLALIEENKFKEAIQWIEQSNHPDKETLLTALKNHGR
jgi:tetratricopeptide (TPR) repeat protein